MSGTEHPNEPTTIRNEGLGTPAFYLEGSSELRSAVGAERARDYRDRLGATSSAVNLRGIFCLMLRKPATEQPPVPPPGLMFRVSGGKKSDVFLRSGRETRDDFAAALEAHGRSFADFQHVLDFGCGCGRVLRWLRQEIAAERLSGCDIDKPAIQWLRWNMPGIDVRTNGGLPPLSFAASTFDLVLGYSVFSHLNEEYQNAWLAELQRVTKPGAFLLLTVQGPYNWHYTKHHILNRVEDLPVLDRQFEEAGFLYWKNDGWGSHFPDYYHSAWHAPSYVRRNWSRWFDVLDIRDAGARPTQDLIVLRKR